jgi:hypothetical protein
MRTLESHSCLLYLTSEKSEIDKLDDYLDKLLEGSERSRTGGWSLLGVMSD